MKDKVEWFILGIDKQGDVGICECVIVVLPPIGNNYRGLSTNFVLS
jgi:hypothetical protein